MSNRWGSEEKKNKGIVGCLIVFFIFGLCVYIFAVNYKEIEGRRQLEKRTKDIIHTGLYKTLDDMNLEIFKAIEDLELQIAEQDIELSEFYDKYNNRWVEVRIKFNFDFNVIGFNWDIHEKVPLIIF